MAFIDTQLYIHQMISVKNFILAADVMKSISLLRYQEESKTLSLVSRVPEGPRRRVGGAGRVQGGRWPRADLDGPTSCPQDAKPLEVYSVDFMVDNAQLGFLGEQGLGAEGLSRWGQPG